MGSTDDKFDKSTNINIKWLKKKGMRGLQTETLGDKLPDEIKVMLVNSLLNDLKIDVQIGMRSGRL